MLIKEWTTDLFDEPEKWNYGKFHGVKKGKVAIGWNYKTIKPLETERELEELNVLQFDTIRTRQENEYDTTVNHISLLEKWLIELKEKKEKYQRERSRLKKGYPALMAAWIGFGAYLGLVAAVDIVLSWHGPTTTLFGTILATIFYVASTALFALACAWLGKGTSQVLYTYMGEQKDAAEQDITSIEEEMKALRAHASRLAEQAWKSDLH